MNKQNILLKGAYNHYNFGDDLLLISVLTYLHETVRCSDEKCTVYINTYERSLEKLKVRPRLTLLPSFELEDVLRRTKRKIERGRLKRFVSLRLMFEMIGIFLSSLIYRATGKAFFFKDYIQFIEHLDVIYFIGGGYIADRWQKRLLYDKLNVLSAKLINPRIRVFGTGLGIGPFKKNVWLLRSFLRHFDFVFVREAFSQSLIHHLKIQVKSAVCGDDVLLLLPFLRKHRGKKRTVEKRFGINLKDFNDHDYGLVADRLKQLIIHLRKNGYTIEFYSFGQYPGPRDSEIIRKLLEKLNIMPIKVYEPYKIGWGKFLDHLSRLTGGLGFAYHFNVLLAIFDIPVISVFAGDYYKQKIQGVMSQLNPEAKIISIESFINLSDQEITRIMDTYVSQKHRIDESYQKMIKSYKEIL